MFWETIAIREAHNMKIGFDHEQYTRMQSERIIQRIDEFGGKLYLELGGKLFDDYHASRVLPGFQPDSKVQMLLMFSFTALDLLSVTNYTGKSKRCQEKSKEKSKKFLGYS